MMGVETGADIFEVLTACALLIVVVLMGVVLGYIAVILRTVHRVIKSVERGTEVLADNARSVREAVKDAHQNARYVFTDFVVAVVEAIRGGGTKRKRPRKNENDDSTES